MRRPVLGTLALAVAVSVSILLPASSTAVTIHQHVVIGADTPRPHFVTRVVEVAPPDTDDDGCANADDSYNGPGCQPPPPPPKPAPVALAAPTAPNTTYYPPATTSGGCPSYMAAEASSPSAVNPSSGAAGCFQILPSTQANYHCPDVGPSCAAAICADVGNAAWSASGATPCDYLKP